jgi:hypothetical protein
MESETRVFKRKIYEAMLKWKQELSANLGYVYENIVAQMLTALAIVDEGLFVGFGFLAVFVQLLGSVEGDVGTAFFQQLVAVLFIKVFAVALLVGTELAAHIVALIELDTAPVQGLHDILLGTWHKAGLVGVLDAEDHLAAVFLGKQVVI